MKVVILAGGLGTRISEETVSKPKPMIEIGGKPILWHIMKGYEFHGLNEFIICCGYKGYTIKEFFSNYFLHTSDVTFDMATNDIIIHKKRTEPWKVTLVDTGFDSMTGGRLGRVKEYLNQDEDFCFTYGDGVGNINISETIKFHKSHGKLATMTATLPPGRFGAIDISGSKVNSFKEKPKGDGAFVNGGFFVLNKDCLNLIKDDATVWEEGPLTQLAEQGELMVHKHEHFWQPMDTLRDKNYLQGLWDEGAAPWKVW